MVLGVHDKNLHHVSVLLNTCGRADLRLGVVLSNSKVILSWPLSSTNFVLESTTDLRSTDWQPVLGPPTTDDGRCRVAVPLGRRQCYFRLRRL